MAVSPKDVELTPEELTEVSQLEQLLDAHLMIEFVSGSKSTEVRLGHDFSVPANRVKNELIRRYKNAGWHDVSECLGRWTFKTA